MGFPNSLKMCESNRKMFVTSTAQSHEQSGNVRWTGLNGHLRFSNIGMEALVRNWHMHMISPCQSEVSRAHGGVDRNAARTMQVNNMGATEQQPSFDLWEMSKGAEVVLRKILEAIHL